MLANDSFFAARSANSASTRCSQASGIPSKGLRTRVPTRVTRQPCSRDNRPATSDASLVQTTIASVGPPLFISRVIASPNSSRRVSATSEAPRSSAISSAEARPVAAASTATLPASALTKRSLFLVAMSTPHRSMPCTHLMLVLFSGRRPTRMIATTLSSMPAATHGTMPHSATMLSLCPALHLFKLGMVLCPLVRSQHRHRVTFALDSREQDRPFSFLQLIHLRLDHREFGLFILQNRL